MNTTIQQHFGYYVADRYGTGSPEMDDLCMQNQESDAFEAGFLKALDLLQRNIRVCIAISTIDKSGKSYIPSTAVHRQIADLRRQEDTDAPE